MESQIQDFPKYGNGRGPWKKTMILTVPVPRPDFIHHSATGLGFFNIYFGLWPFHSSIGFSFMNVFRAMSKAPDPCGLFTVVVKDVSFYNFFHCSIYPYVHECDRFTVEYTEKNVADRSRRKWYDVRVALLFLLDFWLTQFPPSKNVTYSKVYRNNVACCLFV